MTDPRFERSVVYICAHSEDGAMGLVINKAVEHITFPELLEQLGIEAGTAQSQIHIHFGGPVETSRGFVLHSADYHIEKSTIRVSPQVGLTTTTDILKAIVGGSGPRHSLLALGYAGWSAGQLENEIRANGWLNCKADFDLVFRTQADDKWSGALSSMGIDPLRLSGDAGTA